MERGRLEGKIFEASVVLFLTGMVMILLSAVIAMTASNICRDCEKTAVEICPLFPLGVEVVCFHDWMKKTIVDSCSEKDGVVLLERYFQPKAEIEIVLKKDEMRVIFDEWKHIRVSRGEDMILTLTGYGKVRGRKGFSPFQFFFFPEKNLTIVDIDNNYHIKIPSSILVSKNNEIIARFEDAPIPDHPEEVSGKESIMIISSEIEFFEEYIKLEHCWSKYVNW